MKTCPHCGQAVHAEGPSCPLCRQDMRGSSNLPESTDKAWDSGAPHAPPNRSTELEPLWAGKSDEELEEAAHNLVDYTEKGQRVIRAELQRRSIRVPAPEPEEGEEASGDPGESRGSVEFVEFVTVMRIVDDPALLSFAESVLSDAGIVCRHRPDKVGVPSIFGMATMNRWNLQVEAGRVEEASELLDEILKITASELPEESAEE